MYQVPVDFQKISKALTETLVKMTQDSQTSEKAIERLTDAKVQYLKALSFRLTKTY